MPTWQALDEAWRAARTWEGSENDILQRACQHAREEPSAFWDWFLTLGPESRTNGSLLANVLWSWRGTAPVPRRAFTAMLRAAVEEVDPSFNRTFVEPCVRAFGARETVVALLDVLEHGIPFEKAGATNALYWAGLGDEDIGDPVRGRMRQLLLTTFVDAGDLDVRRAIIAKLSLRVEDYPKELHHLIPDAIHIARTSEDAYLRHRVEIQLGSAGPLLPLPHRGERDCGR